jgi:signal transduction histidine kinase
MGRMSFNDRALIVRYTLWACVAWSVMVAASLYWNYSHERAFTLELARKEALANINKDITFRRWATSHGGVYVPPDETTPPDVYLVAPRRDVVTTDGQKLMLMNPAYMMRQMQQAYSETFGIRGHITSLKPLNPANNPDTWETGILEGFNRGDRHNASASAELDGRPYMRAMMPLITEAGCLKCHAHQGYKVGDVPGGISASVPLAPYLEREATVLWAMAASHAGIWIAGLFVFSLLYRRALLRLAEREQAESDIRELNQSLDRRVQERTAALERANAELETFSYSVSHDLRTPLRALNGFARILHEDEAANLSAEGREMLERIWRNAERMGVLIDDILNFSRVGRSDMDKGAVDMESLARSVVDELHADYPAAQVTLGKLPAATGDAAMLRQVWTNLIGNAFKFSSKREQPEIEIGSESENGETVYYVRDNGAGFDMAHAERLFSVFQRMHAAHEYPGTGAGLAIVKRIVERHGGRIWADAKPDQGAVFRYTLAD